MKTLFLPQGFIGLPRSGHYKKTLVNSLLLLALMIVFPFSYASSQTFLPATTPENIYPATVVTPITPDTPGLNAHSYRSTANGFNPQVGTIIQLAAWNEANAGGTEDGYFTYGLADDVTGTYSPVGMETIPNVYNLSVNYLQRSGLAYIIVSYTRPDMFGSYIPRYRLYVWFSMSSTVILADSGDITGSSACHKTLHMATTITPPSVNEPNGVAFAYTSNCGGIWVRAARIVAGSPFATLSFSPQLQVKTFPAKDPLDIAIQRRHPGSPSVNYIHTLVPDGSGNTEVSWVNMEALISIPILTPGVHYGIDDAGYNPAPHTGHFKLDSPDETTGPNRRWSYTWSDGNNIFVRRFNSGMGIATTYTINNGSLFRPAPPSGVIWPINMDANDFPCISYGNNSTPDNIFVGWHTRATVPYSGAENNVAVEIDEMGNVINDLDYLLVPNNNALVCPGQMAFSKHTNTIPNFLYTTFTQDDAGVMLVHKNHDMSMTGTWRTNPTGIAPAQPNSNIVAGPNPFSNTLHIQNAIPGDLLQVQLTDITGRILYAADGSTAAEINTGLDKIAAALPPGHYVLQAQGTTGTRQVFKMEKK